LYFPSEKSTPSCKCGLCAETQSLYKSPPVYEDLLNKALKKSQNMKTELPLPAILYHEGGLKIMSYIEKIGAAIEYIEANLNRKLDLNMVAAAVHYSSHHLQRTFSKCLGLTLHDYLQRRQLTEAAKMLVFSKKSIMDVALLSGYESQQAFHGAFISMYKLILYHKIDTNSSSDKLKKGGGKVVLSTMVDRIIIDKTEGADFVH
jgi:AraC-like DNA-binding protein